jgi:hypothetical protein
MDCQDMEVPAAGPRMKHDGIVLNESPTAHLCMYSKKNE